MAAAVTNMEYGAGYMTGPSHTKNEIEKIAKFDKPGYELMAVISLGVPADGTSRQPQRKPLEEVITFID